MFVCRLCTFVSESGYAYRNHSRVHSNHSSFPCGVSDCTRNFRTLSSFYSHISRDHRLLINKNKHTVVVNVGITVRCQIPDCEYSCPSADLIKHLKEHLDHGTKIMCPAVGCGREMGNRSTFSAHISRKHGGVNKLNITCETNQTLCTSSEGLDLGEHSYVDIESDVAEDVMEPSVSDGIEIGALINNLALFFLKLQCKYHVPVSTIDVIVAELWNVHQLGFQLSMEVVRSKLMRDQVSERCIDELLCELKHADAFHAVLNADDGILRSKYKRFCFYKEKFNYIEPIQKSLGYNHLNVASFCHYVPLKDVLLGLLRDPTVYSFVDLKCHFSKDIFGDLCDGEVHKSIRKTVADSGFLELVLYQDAFEIVNPLGSAKKIHKVVAVYLALANLPSYARTRIDNLQLLMLCRELDLTHFDVSKVFACLIDDLMDLKTNGLIVNNRTISFRLVCVLGDNLGSHWLGGFSCNFSTNQYVCRFCVVRRDNGLINIENVRTRDNYNESLHQVTADASHQGIVRQSVLNSLNFSHVCMPGLPPYLGHDLFEGVVQYDLALILKQLCKKKPTIVYHMNI